MFTIYGAPGCAYCAYAKQLADNLGLDHEYIDVNDDESARLRFRELGFRSIPQIYHQNGSGGIKHIGGYTEFSEYVKEL